MLCLIAGFGGLRAIGKAEAAYFEMINERGGITAVRCALSHMMTNPIRRRPRRYADLIEKDNVLLMFGSFGTPGNFAVRTYLTKDKFLNSLSPPETTI